MQLRLTSYAYPWDLARLGVESTLGEMAAAGIEAIDLAATYHPIDALSPRGGMPRHFTNARGAVHFPARSDRYGRIRPSMSSSEVCAVWPQVAGAASDLGLGINAWTVVLYQPWIVDAYPDCARVLASGDPIGAGVCAANEDVRGYVVELCADMVDQFGIDMIRLEGIMAAGYDYGWLRPRVLIDVPPMIGELLSVCFCASCVKRGEVAGLAVSRIRQSIIAAVSSGLAGESSVMSDDSIESLLDDNELHQFVVQHQRASLELARAVRSRVAGSPNVQLSAVPWSPYRELLGSAKDEFLKELVGTIDQLALVPGFDIDQVRRVTGLDVPGRVPLSLLASPPRRGSAKSYEYAARQLAIAKELGVEEVGIYNFGLLRQSDVREFVETARTAFA